MSGTFPTQRSISQIIRRHTPGSLLYLDEYDYYGKVAYIEGEQDTGVDREHLHARLKWYLQSWEERGGTLRGIDAEIGVDDITPIAPEWVYWRPYPPIFECSDSNCRVIHEGSKPANFTGRCRRCGSALRQMRYVYYHHCGTLSYVKPQHYIKCPKHGHKFLYLFDTGYFATSKWRCRECDYEHDFVFPWCPNAQCREQKPDRPKLQASFWNDQWVHYGQTLDYINLKADLAKRFLRTIRGQNLLIRGGVLGEVPAGQRRLHQALENDKMKCPNCGSELQLGAKFCSMCGTKLSPSLWSDEATSRVLEHETPANSDRCSWALLRDFESSRSLRYEAGERIARIEAATDPYFWGLERAEEAGIWDVTLVTSFPLTTAAIGFTRYQSGPPAAWFHPFRKIGKRKQRYPVYTHTVETEAWLVQIRATAIAEWIVANDWQPWATELVSLLGVADEGELKEWFMNRLVPVTDRTGLATPRETELHDLIQSQIHSLSHLTLLALALHSGVDPTSLGEMLMLDALGFVIYTGGSDLGALTAAFRQLVGVVFSSVIEDYASCKFDPACRHDEGGSCVGCIQLYRGCELFNEKLSRAYLFGGPTGDYAPGEVRHGFFAIAQQ